MILIQEQRMKQILTEVVWIWRRFYSSFGDRKNNWREVPSHFYSSCIFFLCVSSLTPRQFTRANRVITIIVISDAIFTGAFTGPVLHLQERWQQMACISACRSGWSDWWAASKFDILRFSFFNQIYNWWPSAWYWSVCWELKTITFRPPLVHRIEKS